MSQKIDWLIAAENFIKSGDFLNARGAAREVFDLEPSSADGPALRAECEMYLGNFEAAELYAMDALAADKNCFRAKLTLAGTEILKGKHKTAAKRLENMLRVERIQEKKKAIREQLEAKDKETIIYAAMLERAAGWLADCFALLGEPMKVKECLYLASEISKDNRISLLSKFLFFGNYRMLTSGEARRLAEVYRQAAEETKTAKLAVNRKNETGSIRVGYISGAFRTHATLAFLPALLNNPEPGIFKVYVYSCGREDEATRRLKETLNGATWRNVSNLNAKDRALKIMEDKVDILVDLAGHSEGSVMETLMYKPAPVIIEALGYFASAGLSEVDFSLLDRITAPYKTTDRYIENILKLENHAPICYTPEGLYENIPECANVQPAKSNKYVTFGCVQNLCKISDDLLLLWKQAFDKLRDYKLILQNRTIAFEESKGHLQLRLQNLGFKLSNIELLPFSENYLETIKRADIMLDTTPYPGGATTCDSLYMGVPVISLRGNDPWSRLGASILEAADLHELIAETPKEYIKKMLKLATDIPLLEKYRINLRDNLKKSKLMDKAGYQREVYDIYKQIITQN
ncbi:MAG: hypothetical protein IKN43_03425 [Selenomonadaceae bacterium]|nr:hypothetical protein [Selenomonadaceae bacterium]